MHEMSVFWLRAAAVLYSVGLLHALLSILNSRVQIFPIALRAFSAGLVLHIVSLVELTRHMGGFPVNNFYETASVCGLFIGLLFYFVYQRLHYESLSVFLFPLVALMTAIGATEVPVTGWTSPKLRGAWLTVHVMLVLMGYTALLLTAAASISYLLQERRLKQKRPNLFQKIPSLATLDNLISVSMATGFVAITLAVVVGSSWAFIEFGTRWILEPKIAISLLTWGFYLVMVFLRMSAGWRGRRAAVMVLVVLGCSLLTWGAHVGLRRMLV
jgi:ABC-type uncharacterized transport system permease subunit